MRYDEEIHPEDTSTSHGLVVELVGSDKRVLDVGCANGQLGEFLERRGNKVSGIEVDPDLAELARSRLRTIRVGDVEELDLVGELGPASVDVVVFADVLEHLKDPVTVLRAARELVAEGGYVVVSIPNIAHGAPRLALWQGRFEYGEIGLLDDTHLRFFTRSTLENLFWSAGFVITDWRQTTAGPFETEIPLFRQDFPPEMVQDIERDPDSRIYQFVVRAVPIDSRSGAEAVAGELAARSGELRRLRAEVALIARGFEGVSRQPVVGLVEAGHPAECGAFTRLRTGIVLAELRRRLLGFSVRPYGLHAEPAETGLVGEPARPLLPWNESQSAQVCSEAEVMVVVAGTVTDPRLESVVYDLAQAGCRVYAIAPTAPPWAAHIEALTISSSSVSPPGPLPADPMALTGRVLRLNFLQRRAGYLRLLNLLPDAAGFVLAYLTGIDAGDSSRARQTLESAARRAGSELVVMDPVETLGESVGRALDTLELTPIDLATAVATASLVITDSPGLLAVASGLARPALAVASSGLSRPTASGPLSSRDRLVARLDEVVALAPVATADPDLEIRRDQLTAALDLHFDDLAGQLIGASARQLRIDAPARLVELTEQVRTLEAVNEGLRQRLAQEQAVIAGYARQVRHEALDDADDGYIDSSERPWRELGADHAEIERLQREIAAIYATRTMRTLAPLHRVYGRLRAWRR